MKLTSLLFIFIIFPNANCQLPWGFPCPFNKDECVCSGNQTVDPFRLDTVQCNSKSGLIPMFETHPHGRYNVTYDFSILEADLNQIPAHHFMAFEYVEKLVFYHKPNGSQGKVDWHDHAFEGVIIRAMNNLGLNGILPPPIALKNIDGLEILGIACPSAVSLGDSYFNGMLFLNNLVFSNPIKEISPNAFFGLENQLQYLQIVSANFWDLPSLGKSLSNLKQLQLLNLGDNAIVEIKKNTFPKIPLQKLYVDMNPITTVEPGSLGPLKGLREIRIDHTSQKFVDLASFSDIETETLFIDVESSRGVTTLNTSVVDKFPKNTTINFHNAGLENIDSKVGDLLNNILDLTISMPRNIHLKCKKKQLDWVSKIACPERMVIDRSTCKDLSSMDFAEYLKSVDPESKCLNGNMTTENPQDNYTEFIRLNEKKGKWYLKKEYDNQYD